MGNFTLLQALVFEPRQAFTELDARPRYWWPLLLVLVSSAALTFWYTSFVDIEWLVDQQLRQSPSTASMTDAEIALLARQMGSQGGGLRAGIGAGATAIFIAIIMLVSATYYLLAGKITGVERSYRHWLTLATWTSLPTVLGVIPAAIVLFTATSNQIGQEALQPLSLNELIFKRQPGEPGYSLLSNLNLFQFVSLYLAATGVKVWSGRTWLFSIVFTALPLALVFGIWALIALR